jgi:protein required for attachment to host cells
MPHARTWILVADDGRARILRDAFPPSGAPREPELVYTSAHLQARDIMADKPGRSFASVGSRRSSMEYHSDPVRQADKAFAALLLDVMEEHRAAGEFDRLVVAAAPQMLGDLRAAMPASLKAVVVREIDRDYTKMPTTELLDTIGELLRG